MKEISNVLHLEHSFVWCWNLDTSESRSEINRKVLECVAGEECGRSVGPMV